VASEAALVASVASEAALVAAASVAVAASAAAVSEAALDAKRHPLLKGWVSMDTDKAGG
jgi:hypothetical protein